MQRGGALLLVVGVLSMLMILAIELARKSQIETSRAERSVQTSAWRRATASGIQIALALLVERRSDANFAHEGEGWAEEITTLLEADNVELSVRVADESAKINLRTAQGNTETAQRTRRMIGRVFEYLRKYEPGVDWQSLEQKINQRLLSANAPLMTLDNLREEGIPLEYLFRKRATPADVTVLSDVFTTFSSGTININTAPGCVLYGLDENLDVETVARILAWRGDAANAWQPFRKIDDLALVNNAADGSTPLKTVVAKLRNCIDTQSSCFSTRLEARTRHQSHLVWVFLKPAAGTPWGYRVTAQEEIEP